MTAGTLPTAPPARVAAAATPVAVRRIFILWAVIAILLTTVRIAQFLPREFSYAQAWVAADFATMARTFQESGIADLRGVPVNNNTPLGVDVPVYTHWPPLFPLLLSAWYSAFGASEFATHLLMLAIWLAATLTVALLARECFDIRGQCVAVLAWLGMPAIVTFAHAAIHLHLCVLLMLLATLAYLRRSRNWGLIAVAASVLASWEGALLAVGFGCHAMFVRDREGRKLAIQFLAAGVMAAAGIMAWYLTAYPKRWDELIGVVLMRMRLAPSYPVNPLDESGSEPVGSVAAVVFMQLINLWNMLGTLGVFALALLLTETWRTRGRLSGPNLGAMVTGWAGVWIAWYSILSHHAAKHDYEGLIVAPLAAFSLARLTERGMDDTSRSSATERNIAWVFVVPAILLYPVAASALHPPGPIPEESALVAFGRSIALATPEGSVVLTPEQSMVPVYYSHRRIVRGVRTVERLLAVKATLPNAFPAGTRVFFASPNDFALDPALAAQLPDLQGQGLTRIAEITPRP